MSTVNNEIDQPVSLASGVRAVDTSGDTLDLPTPYLPTIVKGVEIAALVERLASGSRPSNGRRAITLVHPESTGRGFAPGIEVTIEVLLPGERTVPIRRSSSLVEIGIEGSGVAYVADRVIRMRQYDVCNVPSMKPHQFVNDGDTVWARLSYSNAPLLAALGTHYYDEISEDWVPGAATEGPVDMEDEGDIERGAAPDYEVSDTGARLRGYEYLVDIEPVPNRALHWPYETVSGLMSQQSDDGKRTIMALYNPATERKQGATTSFFVTLSQIPEGHRPRKEGPGHRHSSVAINYHFRGSGYSVVDGTRIDWEAGDLLLSAPSWREHSHYPSETGMSVYTVQDHPLHIGMESLIWQESMDGPILALGTEAGQAGYIAPRNWDDE